MRNIFAKESSAKIPVPVIGEWSSEVAVADALELKLSADETATRGEIQKVNSLKAGNNRQARAEIIASGKTPEPDNTPQIDALVDRLRDIEAAKEIHRRKMQGIKIAESRRLCLELKPQYDASAAVFVEALLKAHAALLEMDELEIALRAQDIGFYPIICNIRTDRVFGSATDRTGDFAMLLRECVEHGHLKQLPDGLK
jgi:hypothetical protein